MVKARIFVLTALALLCVFTVSGCGNPQKTFTTYGDFQENCTTDCFEVPCDWDSINPVLNERRYEQLGMYPSGSFSFEEYEYNGNLIALFNYPPNDESFSKSSPGAVKVSYGAICSNSVESRNHTYNMYFATPMIQIYLYNPKADKGESDPDYLMGYRAVYSLEGNPVLEEGAWFLDEDKNEFCQHYFEVMMESIGKNN